MDQNDLYQPEPPARDENEVHARHESNRQSWNEGAIHYTATLEESIRGLKRGETNLHPIERRNLGDLRRFSSAIHLQCASGRDTLSLWLEGVQHIAGLDISDVHIANARRMSAALGAPAEWYRCDVLDAPHELDGTADLVYTGRGAICWLHDLDRWGKVIARLLKPGGVFHILDDHPLTWMMDFESTELKFSGVSYFDYSESGKGWPDTYIGDSTGIPVEEMTTKYERLWPLSEIVDNLINAGLVIRHLGEHNEPYWDNFPKLSQAQKQRIPLTFSILAQKPEA